MDMTYDFPYNVHNFLSSLPKHEIQENKNVETQNIIIFIAKHKMIKVGKHQAPGCLNQAKYYIVATVQCMPTFCNLGILPRQPSTSLGENEKENPEHKQCMIKTMHD